MKNDPRSYDRNFNNCVKKAVNGLTSMCISNMDGLLVDTIGVDGGIKFVQMIISKVVFK